MEANPKTLVIRFSSIGDIVLSTPLLRVLRKRFPESQIDYVTRTEYAELIKSNQNLNLTHTFDASEGFAGLHKLKKKIRAEKYDLILDIHDSLRSRYLRSIRGVKRILTIDKRIVQRTMLVKLKKNIYKGIVPVADRYIEPLKQFGVLPDGKGPELHIPDEVLFGVSGKMAKLRLNRFEKVLGICPGSRHFTKRWPVERFAETASRFVKDFDGMVMIFGGENERDLAETVARRIESDNGKERSAIFCGNLTLLETAAAMQYCDVILTNDSGLMHIATAMEKKVVAVFGSTVREFGFFPYGGQSRVLEREGLECRPCSPIGRSECPEGHFRCMLDTTVDEVFDSIRSFISEGEVRVPR
ncbi:MAG TPA: lipopolysaccharide heptosyltransferase II [Bacteroidota bacterium]|nr:lipopolysaccharide heptosyltransferase II [Bacteroidota bacterium]